MVNAIEMINNSDSWKKVLIQMLLSQNKEDIINLLGFFLLPQVVHFLHTWETVGYEVNYHMFTVNIWFLAWEWKDTITI